MIILKVYVDYSKMARSGITASNDRGLLQIVKETHSLDTYLHVVQHTHAVGCRKRTRGVLAMAERVNAS